MAIVASQCLADHPERQAVFPPFLKCVVLGTGIDVGSGIARPLCISSQALPDPCAYRVRHGVTWPHATMMSDHVGQLVTPWLNYRLSQLKRKLDR